MNPLLRKPIFTCPHCGKDSKLPDPLPEKGLFRVSCAICKRPTLIEFKDSSFFFPENPNPTSHHNGTNKQEIQKRDKPPFWERKIQKTSPFHHKDPSPLPGYFLSLKERLQAKQKPTKRKTLPRYSETIRLKPIRLMVFLIGIFCLFTAMYLGSEIIQMESELQVYLQNLAKGKPTKILDRNGQVISEIFQKRVSTLPLKEYPNHLVQTLLYVEDANFYEHNGVDFKALLRAIWKNTIHLSYRQGASTITQQLARILLNDRRKSITRKWKELIVALSLETYLTKDQILEYYMNHVYLGHGAYGFGEAIKFYLKKNPSEITQLEALLLASLASSPNRYSPLKNPENSKRRIQSILEGFKSRGVPIQYSNFSNQELLSLYSNLSTRSPNETVYGNRQDSAPYVTEHIRQILQAITKDLYEEGGYTIETTIHNDIQKHLETVVYTYLQKVQKSGIVKRVPLSPQNTNHPYEIQAIYNKLEDSALLLETTSGIHLEYPRLTSESYPLQAAVLGLNPLTGEVLFLHGGDRFGSDNQFNRAIKMKRQTGSSIKPILFSAAIDSKVLTTTDKILDAPLIYRGTGGLPNWTPDNLSKSYDGEINLRYALVKSKNTAAVQVAEKLGWNGLNHYLSVFFFPESSRRAARLRVDLSLALGSLELSPLEMAQAYSAFLNEGKIMRPYLIRKIYSPEGKVMYESGDEFDLGYPSVRNAIRPDTAEIMLSLLKDSAKSVSLQGYRGPVAGKTGTTNDHRDAWFIGLLPGLSMAVWVGYDNSSYGMGNQALGGTVAAPLWMEIAKTIDKEKAIPKEEFPKPMHAVLAKVCEAQKWKCGDCPPNQEWFLQDNIPPCKSSPTPSTHDEVFQDLF